MTQTVIIAVDDPNIRYLLQRYAEENGLLPITTSHGADVANLLSLQPGPALLILDVEYSEAPPFERDIADARTTDGLRATAAAYHIPVVLYSCLDEPPDESIEGVIAQLPKSVMYDDFVEAVRSVGVELDSASHV